MIGGDQAPALAFFPGMDISSERNTQLLRRVLSALRKHYDLVPMGVHADSVIADADMRVLSVPVQA